MDLAHTYWLEELKQSDSKIQKLDDIMLSLVKFYFVTLFSVVTAGITLYNYHFFDNRESWLFWIFVPSFFFGVVTLVVMRSMTTRYTNLETTRNQISEWFIHGEVKNEFKNFGTPFSPFYSLMSWLVIGNFFVGIYFAFPVLRSSAVSTVFWILLGLAIAGIFSSVVLASLNSARRKARDAVRRSNIAQLRVALELYHDEHGHYPISGIFQDVLQMLQPYLNRPISDPLADSKRLYEYHSADGVDYAVSFELEDDGVVTVNSNTDLNGNAQ